MPDKPTMAILYICTGHYWKLFETAYSSIMGRLFPELCKTFFVWTDHEADLPKYPNARVFHKDFKRWPDASITRYAEFIAKAYELQQFDYCMFVNANIEVLQPVSFDIIDVGKIWVVQHRSFLPGTLSVVGLKNRLRRVVEKRKESEAYIGEERLPFRYCFSGFTGGPTAAFLSMSAVLAHSLNKDAQNGIVPIWHDESMLNRYILDHPDDFQILPPKYLYPEELNGSTAASIIVRHKPAFFRYINYRAGV